MSKYKSFLALMFVAVWTWAAINPKYPHDWLLENYLVFLFVPVIVVTGRYFRLSNVSYTLITLFLCLHLVGSHYTYAEVPFGDVLQKWVGSDRNMYDRLVHFSFGFLLSYPIREAFMRLAKVKGVWAYYLPLDVTLSFSAVYEIIEWLTALRVNPAAGIAFLGSQGDVWDAQKDMLMAGIGSLLAMTIIAIINMVYNRGFATEFKESFTLAQDDKPLGEVRLKEYIDRQG